MASGWNASTWLSRAGGLMWLNAALVLLVAIAIVAVEAVDRPEAAIEASVRRYAAAVAEGDLDSAMAEIAPAERSRWRDWVNGQLGNVYDVTGVAVHAPRLFSSPTDVTVDLDVNRGFPDQFYQASPRVDVESSDGRFYLASPLLAPL